MCSLGAKIHFPQPETLKPLLLNYCRAAGYSDFSQACRFDCMKHDSNTLKVFWGCFIALVTTAFGFMTRVLLIGEWAGEFGLDPAQAGRLAGIGIWPFAVSIIAFSLVIDKIGYKVAMYIAFIGHAIWAVMAFLAYGQSQAGNTETAFQMLYWGSLLMALANGTVEAFINPVVATIFNKEKTKWLNILHAGWPGGLVICGLILISMQDVGWNLRVGLIALPAIVYVIMLAPVKFPVQERVSSGVSYKEMLGEFGVLGALVVGFLTTLQLMDFFSAGDTSQLSGGQKTLFIAIGIAIVAGFGIYTKARGSVMLFILVLLMMPLATTEIGTDGWITNIMAKAGAFEGGNAPEWILVYTSAIMMVLRLFAGPIVHKLSPLGLLAACAALAIVGLLWLSGATSIAIIFAAATFYAIGKSFFWPTMIGIVAEQTPKGGALTLNAIAGIGMLAVGTLGFPYIGALQSEKAIQAVENEPSIVENATGLFSDGKLTATTSREIYEIIEYDVIEQDAVTAALALNPKKDEIQGKMDEVVSRSAQGALANMAIFPAIMLIGYLALIFYFRSKGGYKPVSISSE